MQIARRGHALIVGKATKYSLSLIYFLKDQTLKHSFFEDSEIIFFCFGYCFYN
jgi:hypothetical protein